MNLQGNLPIEVGGSVCTMAADKKSRIFEAYAFQDLPIEKLVLKKPNLVTQRGFYIPELKDSIRTALFKGLRPSAAAEQGCRGVHHFNCHLVCGP